LENENQIVTHCRRDFSILFPPAATGRKAAGRIRPRIQRFHFKPTAASSRIADAIRTAVD
jgi:hypothetical protein